MACQLALLFARRLEVPVVLTDLDQARVDKGVGYVHGEIDKLVAKGRLDAGKAAKLRGLVTGSVDKAAFADADLVIEAVFEDLAVKKQVWAEVEKIVSPECVLATNTSSLSVTEMAADLEHPERVVGFHFFNPVAVLPLLEIVRGERTDDATLATAFAVGKAAEEVAACWSRTPRRSWSTGCSTRFLGEVFAAVDAGTPLEVADARARPAGPADAAAGAARSWSARRSRGTSAGRCTRRSRTGSRSARTCAAIAESGLPLLVDDELNPEVVGAARGRRRAADRRRGARAGARRAGRRRSGSCSTRASSPRPQDIDLCMILGAGWPFHLGGITPYLDRTGVSERVTGQRFLPKGVASLP